MLVETAGAVHTCSASGEKTAEDGMGFGYASDTRWHLRREGLGMDIRIITEHDVEEFIRLRLEALTREPYAFARALEDEHSRSPESIAPRLRATPEGNFVVGVFAGRHMVGQAGFVRYEGRKERHKGTIWGVYVTAAARGQGVAKAMLTQLLDRVRGYPGLEQVSLSVSIPQEAARQLYSALGFEVYGYEKHALKVGETYVDEEHRVLWLQEPLSAEGVDRG
jgi:RimJ/RimL family protein N-acetyltransferase